jgi:hypothetical protein
MCRVCGARKERRLDGYYLAVPLAREGVEELSLRGPVHLPGDGAELFLAHAIRPRHFAGNNNTVS